MVRVDNRRPSREIDIMSTFRLSEQELNQFLTIENLTHRSEGKDPDSWGLCQNEKGEVSFTEAGGEWILQVPLNEVYEKAIIKYGENYDSSDTLLFYGVDCSGTNDLCLDFIQKSSYKTRSETQHFC